MAERELNRKRKIGLLLTGDYNWAGGIYYVLNIIKSLNFLNESDKPEIIIFYSNNTPKELLKEINYPHSTFVNLNKYNLFYRALYKIYRAFFNKNLQLKHIINPFHLDALYPLSEYFPDLKLNCLIVYWIYDLQHKYMPEMFSKKEIEKRDKQFEDMSKYAKKIVFSSYDSLNSFKIFYPDTKAFLSVLQFVSAIGKNNIVDFDTIKIKYKIDRPYFIVANQFWLHKNHIAVLKALTILKEDFPDVFVIFTGKQYDHRNPSYFIELKNFIEEDSLNHNILFTNFILRAEQLTLIKNSIAVIQPSKFEGWSTVVEDTKTLNKPIILSDINVHREQIDEKGYFFSPDDYEKLADIMKSAILNNEFLRTPDFDYLYRVKKFAQDFIEIF